MSLRLAGVRYRYAGAAGHALDGIDLEIEPGEVVGIVGANDAGKSSLCLVAAGLAPATVGGDLEGAVEVDGLDTAAAAPWEAAQRCGILFEDAATQISGTAPTVWEEVAFGPRNLGLPVAGIVARVEEALAALAVGALAARDPAHLSGGEAQLVALAGVLAMRPAYLVLDEPTSQLDPYGTRLVGEAIAGLARATGAGVLIAEHKTDLLDALLDRVLVLEGGRAVALGPAHEVLADERLEGWGVAPPSRVRVARAAARAGIALPAGVFDIAAPVGARP